MESSKYHRQVQVCLSVGYVSSPQYINTTTCTSSSSLANNLNKTFSQNHSFTLCPYFETV